jgi:hypothetical protein
LQGKRILVAVELSAIDNAQFQDAWSAPHSVFEERLTSNGWSGRRDGVTSFAMLKMLSQLHALKDRGADISLVAFNGFKDEAQRLKLDTPSSQDGHEAAQAENISEAPCAPAVHADRDFLAVQHAGKGLGRELAALVGIEYLGLAITRQRLFQSFHTEPYIHRDRHPPAEDPATEPVNNGDQIVPREKL